MRASRLAFIFVFSLLIAGVFTAPASAQRITIDVTPLARKGGGELAAHIRSTLPGKIKTALAGKYSGPLTVRIRGAMLYQYTGFGIVQPTDYLEGDLLIPGRPPQPILLALPVERSPTMLTPYGVSLRINYLLETFAQWIAKYT